ncbi:MAG: site-specific DNA-methyltransferase, partial [Gammaproteobacteria bacterium]|nr:site-specific DNA-methyltransferase [Gammaproteobacteria bacterium]
MATLNIKPNALFTADNLYVLNGMNSACIDLIYLDPPFNSKRLYKAPVGSKAAGAAFEDMWSWKDVDSALMVRLSETHPFLVDYITAIERIHSKAMMAYIAYMAQRLFEMHRVLKDTGSIYLHCDPTASHYLKVVMDRVFGKNNFRNELVWHYKGASMTAAAKIYPRKHDVILFYTKSETYTFNPPRQSELSDVMKQRWGKYIESDGKSILWKSIKNEPGQVRKFLGKLTKQLGRPPRDDDVAWVANPSLVRSVWVDLPEVRNNPKYLESTGYPTQKPLKLLQRIISASSNEGDVVLDPFCGCATTCVAAQHLHRRWIGIDISETTGDLIRDRLKDDVGA